MRKPKMTEKRISVFCRCGAQWHGRYALDNPHVARHRLLHGAPVHPDEFAVILGHTVKLPAAWQAEDRFIAHGKRVDAVRAALASGEAR